jgi:DNA-binding transcriptional ArsR family regulator
VDRSRPSRLLPILRSEALGRVLAAIYLAPEAEPLHIRAIADRTSLPYATVHREVSRLLEAGLAEATEVGRARVVRPNRASPYFDDLQSLMLKSYGPTRVLGDALQGQTGVRNAYVYGSWASRYLGEPGPDPQDVDVVVLVDDDADRDAIEDDLVAAGARLARQVNPVLIDEADWNRADTAFLRTLKTRPLIELPIAGTADVN